MAENPSIRETLERGEEETYKGLEAPPSMAAAGAGAERERRRKGGVGWCGGLRGGGRVGVGVVVAEDPPARIELVGWYAYAVCSFFVLAVLVPVLFPLIIAQIASSSDSPSTTATTTMRGVSCSAKEMALYQRLVKHSIDVGGSRFSALHWTVISWAAGVIAVAPLLPQVAHQLDRGHHQSLLLIAAITFGAFFCLLTGFFKTAWLFPFYIIFIVSAITVSDSAHSRYLALMLRGLTASSSGRHLSLRRRAAGGQLSLYSTAAGSLGAAVIAAFVYHMLRRSDQLTGLWVVSIFSGLIWFIAICHGLFSNRPASSISSSPSPSSPPSLAHNMFDKVSHALAVFSYPHAVGSLAAVFLSSFSTMCIFTAGILYIIGGLCIKPVMILSFLIIYFAFPVLSLPGIHALQLLLRTDAVRMQLLGFLLCAFVSGAGFYFKDRRWRAAHVILVGLVQSTAAGALHAFGRVLLLDCAPPGKEGAFAAWLAWARAAGAGVGFAVGSASPGRIGAAFGAAFLASLLGGLVLVFGSVSDEGALVAAGHVRKEELEYERKMVGEEGMSGIGLSSNSGEDREGYIGRVRV
ncbi:hypothetical protein ACMD2_04437 [Ananas comosus]|uniref:Uncharacterized protein n=1 Tax=Ananas comosus TaxID=4615 RepID=A0A199UUP9_ANACO|nr:hypothetical protein ACMD2_04437 [Ananas comosus]